MAVIPGPLDMLTAAAQRVVQAAEERAAAARREPNATDALRSILADESHAAELLANAGFTASALEDAGDDVSVRLEVVVARARRIAERAGARDAVGTEHLLWGLVSVESTIAKRLQEYGVTAESVAEAIGATADEFGPPLPVDVEIVGSDRRERERTATFRILDAAANRAREGLRVVEDYVRFVMDDALLAELAKSARHALTSALSRFDATSLLHARDTVEDVGTTITTAAESRRDSAEDTLRASLKRLQEALRTLEEYGKTIDVAAAEALERVRYESYTLEKAVLGTVAARRTFDDRLLYLLLTRSACRGEPESVVREALAGGVDVVQLREKTMPDREFVHWGREVRRWTREHDALLIVNDRPDLAVLVDADGVHVGQDELTVAQCRRILGAGRLVGVSTHDLDQARRAVVDGADSLGVGPTFPSGTKTFEAFPGLDFVAEVAAAITLPWYPLGGIDDTNVAAVTAAGATRIAVCGAICGAENPRQAAGRLRSRLS